MASLRLLVHSVCLCVCVRARAHVCMRMPETLPNLQRWWCNVNLEDVESQKPVQQVLYVINHFAFMATTLPQYTVRFPLLFELTAYYNNIIINSTGDESL